MVYSLLHELFLTSFCSSDRRWHTHIHTHTSSSPFILFLLSQNRIIYHTSCKTKQKKLCVCLTADDKERVFSSFCQSCWDIRKNCAFCVFPRFPLSVSPLGCLVWPSQIIVNTSFHINPFYHTWLRVSMYLCSLVFSFNHLYPREPLHYVRLLNCKIIV